MKIETDYLVVGAGASGLAFTDALVAETDAEMVVVERRAGPGGHWLDAYPFVRLHIPSAYYGVGSLPLGEDRIDEDGENAGFYERATGEEVRRHFAQAAEHLTRTGRVRILFEHEHVGPNGDGEQVRDLTGGEVHEVTVRRRVVDVRYLEASVPATHTPSFEVAPGANVVPVNDLPAAAGSASSYAILG
ncbi:MAG: NAD(P)-binding protein, partial [Actinomycetota bacterium]|nr:NAD(P)-binding protein [Actinomycetota bacterium]